ncbi:YihY/virulence factor BrkB family protein [bacterium]|nr:YihY/virulence factor BrkB family protein [bacterium]NCQ55144.1 YihY/virulence factor BrkB family protein [Candidatus Parcubacteria bacterium]NCS67343.1 YihY/virulence factor BrkB family protein [Candidatus Peregrinibacteria bacterium]NCS96598.1 YihY/virulence factor BrkB family protein [bacterium]
MKALKLALTDSIKSFGKREITKVAAATAYYGLFALPALLITLWYGLFWLGYADDAFSLVIEQLQSVLGPEAAQTVSNLVETRQNQTVNESFLTALFGVALLAFAVMGLFGQIQWGLSKVWGFDYHSLSAPWYIAWGKKFLGIVVIIVGAIGLVASLLFSVFQTWLFDALNIPFSSSLAAAINQTVTLLLSSFLLALIYWGISYARMKFKVALMGGFITSLMLGLGKFGLAWYFANGGASAGSGILLVILFLYYVFIIFFLGAGFTHDYAKRLGYKFAPSPYIKAHAAKIEIKHLGLFQKISLVFKVLLSQIKLVLKILKIKKKFAQKKKK